MHVLVVGSGISGLTVSYAFEKLGHQVTLVDKDTNITGSTSQQHGWFHSGNLYLLAEDFDIYKAFWENKILLNIFSQDFNAFDGSHSWLTDNFIDYHFHNRRTLKKADLEWDYKLKRMILRMSGNNLNRFSVYLNYARKSFEKSELMPDSFIIKSTDRTMNTNNIVTDFINYLYRSPAVHILEDNIEKTSISLKKKIYCDATFDKIFLCCGDGINNFYPNTVSSVYSLLAQLKGNQFQNSFVFVHPDKRKTINCMLHKNHRYEAVSIIGDGENFEEVPDFLTIKDFKEKIAKFTKDKIEKIIIGKKTEIISNEPRNYLPIMVEKDPDVFVVTPGKFSNFPTLVKFVWDSFGYHNRTLLTEKTWYPAHKL